MFLQEVISDVQNAAASYTGDGPLQDLTFTITGTAAAVVDVVVTDFQGNSYATVTGAPVAGDGTLPSWSGSQATLKEASKVRIALGAADQSGLTTIVKVHVTPVIKAFNPTYALASSVQQFGINTRTAGSTYRLEYNGVKTDYITFDHTAALTGSTNVNTDAVQRALNALSTIYPGFVKVTAAGKVHLFYHLPREPSCTSNIDFVLLSLSSTACRWCGLAYVHGGLLWCRFFLDGNFVAGVDCGCGHSPGHVGRDFCRSHISWCLRHGLHLGD